MNNTLLNEKASYELEVIKGIDINVYIGLKTNIENVLHKLLAKQAENAFRNCDRTHYALRQIEPRFADAFAAYTGLKRGAHSYVFCERRSGSGHAALYAVDKDRHIIDRRQLHDANAIHDLFATFEGGWGSWHKALSSPAVPAKDNAVQFEAGYDPTDLPWVEEVDSDEA